MSKINIQEFMDELIKLGTLTETSINNQSVFYIEVLTTLHVNPSIRDINNALFLLDASYNAKVQAVKKLLKNVKEDKKS